MRTRLAPTPSGYLHAGNAVNALLVAWLARSSPGAQVHLRIDDADSGRARPEYLEDVFRVYRWLGVEWDLGPQDPDEYRTLPTQAERRDYFRAELEAAVGRGLPAYACTCSRRDAAGSATGCAGGCREAGAALTGATTVRVSLPTEMGLPDPVLWRRDDLPAYHLVSLVSDRDAGVTHVVRGDDLIDSTALHLHLAPWFAAERLRQATWLHHGLLLDADGGKLSKSAGSGSAPMSLTDESLEVITVAARNLAGALSIAPAGPSAPTVDA